MLDGYQKEQKLANPTARLRAAEAKIPALSVVNDLLIDPHTYWHRDPQSDRILILEALGILAAHITGVKDSALDLMPATPPAPEPEPPAPPRDPNARSPLDLTYAEAWQRRREPDR